VLTLRRLLLSFALLAVSGVAQDAFAARFGLQTGFYSESINTPCARSREFGLRLGFYADKTTNDILYASAVNGTNLCGAGVGPCGAAPLPSVPDCGCGGAALAPAPVVSCGGTPAIPGYLPPPGCGSAIQVARPACGCANVAPIAPPACGSPFAAPVQQAASPNKTEIYLLVLPETRPAMSYQQQPAYYQPQPPAYQQPPMADYRRAPQGYYKEPTEYQEPVRGLW
jgi:hypothetical protein